MCSLDSDNKALYISKVDHFVSDSNLFSFRQFHFIGLKTMDKEEEKSLTASPVIDELEDTEVGRRLIHSCRGPTGDIIFMLGNVHV